MAPIYGKLDVREKKSIHNTFVTDIQATRTDGERFFLVLDLQLTKYVTLGNALSAEVVHHFCI